MQNTCSAFDSKDADYCGNLGNLSNYQFFSLLTPIILVTLVTAVTLKKYNLANKTIFRTSDDP